ncbi:hypothetical protein WICPIJ_007501 [Wickerhamomyces pijperi]|uniref:Mitochondrial distribution and morphology protein 12 n=1 Tax=Wickerhamomyces pijperi TaxID=599730 RepID=A0A9P8Q1I5_WICPI|nr:hypothetical protein WICPIJ_007501 [Wickerhamomyces pijperi]
MSIDINWSTLSTFTDHLQKILNEQLRSIELPDFLSNLQITSISLGTESPLIDIKHIGEPFEEFYAEVGSPEAKSINDIQFLVELDYKGDIMVEIQCDLLMNYPSTEFIKLPVTLRIVELSIHSLIILAYLQKQAFISFLCDLDDGTEIPTTSTGSPSSADDQYKNMKDRQRNSVSRIDIIKDLKIENEIGDAEGSILRNVGKVEKFIVDLLRGLLRDEVAWPGWINLDFGDEDHETDTPSSEGNGDTCDNSSRSGDGVVTEGESGVEADDESGVQQDSSTELIF